MAQAILCDSGDGQPFAYLVTDAETGDVRAYCLEHWTLMFLNLAQAWVESQPDTEAQADAPAQADTAEAPEGPADESTVWPTGEDTEVDSGTEVPDGQVIELTPDPDPAQDGGQGEGETASSPDDRTGELAVGQVQSDLCSDCGQLISAHPDDGYPHGAMTGTMTAQESRDRYIASQRMAD